MGAAFLHMIPEAAELLHGKIGWAVLIGLLIFYFLEKFIMIHPCQEDDCEYHHIGVPAFLGFSFHNLTDGIALAASFFVPKLTPYVFMALIAHHIPTSFAFTSILKVARYKTKKILILLLIFALMVPLGTVVSHALLLRWDEAAVGWAVGISAGTFIHIAVWDLLPEVHKSQKNKWKNTAWFVAGLGLMVVLSVLLNHSH